MREPSSNRQLSQCNDCNGRFTTTAEVTMWSRRLYKVVKGRSPVCEVVKPAGSYCGDLWRWGHSPVDIDSHELSSWDVLEVVLEPDNCFALFYFVINAHISHVIITLIRYFLIPKSRDLVSHNPGISGLKNGPGSRDSGLQSLSTTLHCGIRSAKIYAHRHTSKSNEETT